MTIRNPFDKTVRSNELVTRDWLLVLVNLVCFLSGLVWYSLLNEGVLFRNAEIKRSCGIVDGQRLNFHKGWDLVNFL